MPLKKPEAFFDVLRASPILGPVISETEVQGCNAILAAMSKAAWSIHFAAYGLATAYHETAGTMLPIKEYGGPSYFTRRYDINGANPRKARELGNLIPGDGVKFCGRGYVQLTGRTNYKKASTVVGVDLVSYPDKAMDPVHASSIMISGMTLGWFTGKKLSDYLSRPNVTRNHYAEARRVINGVDRAGEIADFALKFQEALAKGEWR